MGYCPRLLLVQVDGCTRSRDRLCAGWRSIAGEGGKVFQET